MGFLLSLNSGIMWLFGWNLWVLLYKIHKRNNEFTRNDILSDNWISIVLCSYSGLALPFPCILLIFHIYLNITAQTTNERLRTAFKHGSPYSRGCIQNIINNCCTLPPKSNVHITHKPPKTKIDESLINKKKMKFVKPDMINKLGTTNSKDTNNNSNNNNNSNKNNKNNNTNTNSNNNNIYTNINKQEIDDTPSLSGDDIKEEEELIKNDNNNNNSNNNPNNNNTSNNNNKDNMLKKIHSRKSGSLNISGGDNSYHSSKTNGSRGSLANNDGISNTNNTINNVKDLKNYKSKSYSNKSTNNSNNFAGVLPTQYEMDINVDHYSDKHINEYPDPAQPIQLHYPPSHPKYEYGTYQPITSHSQTITQHNHDMIMVDYLPNINDNNNNINNINSNFNIIKPQLNINPPSNQATSNNNSNQFKSNQSYTKTDSDVFINDDFIERKSNDTNYLSNYTHASYNFNNINQQNYQRHSSDNITIQSINNLSPKPNIEYYTHHNHYNLHSNKSIRSNNKSRASKKHTSKVYKKIKTNERIQPINQKNEYNKQIIKPVKIQRNKHLKKISNNIDNTGNNSSPSSSSNNSSE